LIARSHRPLETTIMPTAEATKHPPRSRSSPRPGAPARPRSGPKAAAAAQAAKATQAARVAKAPRAATAAAQAEPSEPRVAGSVGALAHAVGTAKSLAGQVTHFVAGAADHTLAINPLVGIDRRDVARAATALLKAVAVSPRRATGQFGQYVKELGRVVKGSSELSADPKDRRFADPAWKTNLLYRRLMQSYLATQKELDAYIDGSDLSKVEKGRAHFFASLVVDALAPPNWLLGNPAAVRKILDTGGTHLVDGLKNLVHDARHNRMLPSQVDATPFQVGVNVAASPGQVVLQHEMFELLQFAPTTPQVHRRPLVMVPPQVNKYYAVDLGPDKSLVKWTVDSGVQMFVISWRNPTVEQRHWGLEHYVMAIDAAVDAARQITGSPDVSLWGSCSGGMSAAAYLGWLAGTGERKVVNATWAVCILDMNQALEDSTLGLFNSPTAIRAAKARSRRAGIVTGQEMASMFAWLRPNDLIWNYWVNNYLLGNKPPAYDILAWNADTTRLPGQFHCDLLDVVAKNPYVNPGALEIDGVPIDMSKVELDAYVIGGITDHITPWRGCYGTARLFGPDSTFVLANAGHLQSLINPPGTPKSFYIAAPAAAEDPMQWAERMQPLRQDGSWWPHWRQWIQARSGERVPAPRKQGSRKHRPLGPAPGAYVLER
jgi:polyhydroxyalkanoate synthase